MTRTKPTNALRDATNVADTYTYEFLAQEAIKAVIERQWNLYLQLPYFVKFEKGFPRGILHKKTATTDIFKVKTRKLLDWLYKEGYTTLNTAAVMAATRAFAYQEGNIERMFTGSFDEPSTNNVVDM